MPKRSPTQRRSSKRVARTPNRKSTRTAADGPVRLQKVLASAGFGSRRQCEDLIEEGRVMVDGEIITKLGTTVDPKKADIYVDDNSIRPAKLVYYAVHKPTGVVTTNRDPQGRPRVIDLVPPTERVFPVGRLDRSSEGLILLTNDGDLAQRLAHPKFGVKKVYRVTVAGKVTGETMKQMRQGIYISEGMVRVEGAKILKAKAKVTEMEIVLREGKNREIRRILARLGHKVQTLRRIAIGPLRLGDVPPGAYRTLRREEIAKLQQSTIESESVPSEYQPPRKKTASKTARRKPKSGVAGESSGPRETANSRSTSKPGSAKRSTAKRGTTKRSNVKKNSKTATRKAPALPRAAPRTGAVIGGDPIESNASRPKRNAAARSSSKKRSGTKKSGGGTRSSSKKRSPRRKG